MSLFGGNKPLTDEEMEENLKKLGAEKVRLAKKANYETKKKTLIDDIEKEKQRIKSAQPQGYNNLLPFNLSKRNMIILGIIVIVLIVFWKSCTHS